MKHIYIHITTLLITLVSFAQVGVNTNNPQQTLHVGGPIETIRIDGLSEANNVDNLGPQSTSRVYIDDNGDLSLGRQEENIEILFDYENYLQDVENPTSLINQTGNAFGYNPAGIPIDGLTATFTLTRNAIIEINYSVSWSVYKSKKSKSNPNGRIDDERARIVQTGIFFRRNNYLGPAVVYDVDGNAINSGPWCIDTNASGTICHEKAGLLGISGQFYNNADQSNGEYLNFHNTGSDYVKLGPGTYTPMFAAQLAVGDTSGTGAVKMFLGSGKDDIQIIAHYYTD